jgi:hypothetical protein
MEQKISIAKMRSSYCKQVEKEHRSLSSYLAEINKDFDAYAAGEQAATTRRKESFSFFAASAMKKENLSLAYLKTWYAGIDTQGRICDFRKVELSEESSAADKYKDCDIIDKVTFSVALVPISLWSASRVLQKIASAIKAERDAASAAAQAVREQERAEKERAQMERLAAKLAAYQAKQAAQAAQPESSAAAQPESKSKSSSKSSSKGAAQPRA